MDTPQDPLPLPASDLFAIVDMLRASNASLSPGAKMLGVTSNGNIVLGRLMPSGKILCAGGEAEECPWTCEAESALTVIGCLSAAAEQMRKMLAVATDALRYYNSHDCLTTEQQQCAADALRDMANKSDGEQNS